MTTESEKLVCERVDEDEGGSMLMLRVVVVRKEQR